MDTRFTQKWIRKFRFLTLSLVFSGALNIGLIAALAAVLLQEKQPVLSFVRSNSNSPLLESSNAHSILAMSKLSFRELCACLTNKEPVEEGYAKRDLALAALVAYRHLDIEKALAGSLHQRRQCSLDGEQIVEMYPGLTDEQFKAILQFVYLEKWPLTPEGLFKIIQKAPEPRDESLDLAFAMTPQCPPTLISKDRGASRPCVFAAFGVRRVLGCIGPLCPRTDPDAGFVRRKTAPAFIELSFFKIAYGRQFIGPDRFCICPKKIK